MKPKMTQRSDNPNEPVKKSALDERKSRTRLKFHETQNKYSKTFGSGGIVMYESRGKTGPLLICHGCGERIRDFRYAGVTWTLGELHFRTYHKGGPQCLSNSHERYSPWIEFSEFIVHLARNVGMSVRDFSKAFKSVLEEEGVAF